MERNSLALSAVTGSFTSSILWLLRDWVFDREWVLPGPLPGQFDCPALPETIPLNFWWGLLAGFLLWPAIELLVLLKQWATLSIRARLAGFVGTPGQRLYKVL